MAGGRRRVAFNKNKLFSAGTPKQFRKGDVYRDPRINQSTGQKDFLMLDNCPEDMEFLREYLANELENYPCEAYNMISTGLDKNGVPLIGTFWVDDRMDHAKKALILCRGGCEEEVLDIVDQFCVAPDAERVWERDAERVQAAAKPPVVVQKLPPGPGLKPLPPSLSQFKK